MPTGTTPSNKASAASLHSDAASSSEQGGRQNRLLRAFPADAYARLATEWDIVHVSVKQTLWDAGTSMDSVYFPLTCVVSLLIPLTGQRAVEATTVGYEGMVGTPVALGIDTAFTTALVQIAGEAVRVSAAALRSVIADDAAVLTLLLRYAQSLYDQTAQSVACNAKHSLEERCARWLLMTHDRVGQSDFHLTHELLANMLGVRRAGVTVAAGALQRAGLLSYSRGHITILDRPRLMEASCECYRVVKERYELLFLDWRGTLVS